MNDQNLETVFGTGEHVHDLVDCARLQKRLTSIETDAQIINLPFR